MPIVFDNIELPGTTYDVLARVDVYLVANEDDLTVPGVIPGSDISILDKFSAYTNGAGYVQFNLRANSLITPGGTYYVWETHFKDGRVNKRYIEVPNGAGPYHVADIETSVTPPVPSSASLPVRYAAPWGDDSNDGKSWGTPKLHVMKAYDALPANGGTVYFTDNTQCDTATDTGIWIAGVGDPNYASLPAGWRQAKACNFIGVGNTTAGGGFGRQPQATLLGGSASDANKPLVAISTRANFQSFENIAGSGQKRNVVIGLMSDGNVHNTGYLDNGFWRNVNMTCAQTAGAGPTFTIQSSIDTVFWQTFEWVNPTSNATAAVTADERRTFLISGAYLIDINHGVHLKGGIKYTTPNVGWVFTVNDLQGENDFVSAMPPLVDIYGNQSAGHAKISNVNIYDAPGTAACVRNNALPAECVSVDGGGAQGFAAVAGPHINVSFERVSNGSLAATQSYGPQRWRDVGRRAFGFTSVPRSVPQLANHSPASWTGRSHGSYPTGGNATVTLVAGFNGVANAAGALTWTGAGDRGDREVTASRTIAVGDHFVFAVWQDESVFTADDGAGEGARLRFVTAGFLGTTDLLNELGSPTAQVFGLAPASRQNYNGKRPAFSYVIVRVTALGVNPCAVVGEMSVMKNNTIIYQEPTLLHFPNSWSSEQVANFVDGMNTIPYLPNVFTDDVGGDLVSHFGQRIIAPGGVMAAINADSAAASGIVQGLALGSFLAYNSGAGQYFRLGAQGTNPWDMMMATTSGAGDTWRLRLGSTAEVEVRADGLTADTETVLLVRRNVGGAFSLQRVSMGAADSGGAGFKLLRVPN